MATAKYFLNGPYAGQLITDRQELVGAATEGGFFALTNTFDATLKYANTAGGANVATAGNGLDATDLAEVLAIPANTLVMKVFATVVTAEGATQVVDIGDGTDPDGFLNDFDANGAAGATSVNELALTEAAPNTVTGYSNGKFYSAADTIDVTAITNDYGVGKIRLTAVCFAPLS